ncbi:hypothetical protein ACF3NG_10090 [Aerococcaceae bacterium WGS1372]
MYKHPFIGVTEILTDKIQHINFNYIKKLVPEFYEDEDGDEIEYCKIIMNDEEEIEISETEWHLRLRIEKMNGR